MLNQPRKQFTQYEIEGSFNVRDLGGYTGRDGKVLKTGRFIRAGSLSELTPDGIAAIKALGVDCVVDFRSAAEVERMPDAIEDHRWVAYRHISMLDYIQSSISAGDFTTFPKSMAEMYCGLLDNSQDKMRLAFEVFADPACKTILFHCTAGKDRTGVTAMLLLLLAGVSEADVVEDYAWTDKLETGLKPPEGDHNLPLYLFESKEETMWEAIAHLNEAYGGAESYLDKIGVTPEDRGRIIAKFFQE